MSDVIAAIDVGTNSIHLVVARATDGSRFEVLDKEKEVVRLGHGSGDMKRMEPDAVDRGITALERFRQVAETYGASIHAVATSAVREAENRDVFLERAREEAGVEVEVISGIEEARLIQLGVLQATPTFDQQMLLVDIGGGSTELVVGRGGEMLVAKSLKLGTIRLTDRFFQEEPVRSAAVEECRQYVRAYLKHVSRDIRRAGFEVAVGSSGTIMSVAEMIRARQGKQPSAPASSSPSIAAGDLARVVKALLKARTVKERLKVPGLESKRADIILGGAILLEQLFAELEIDTMLVSDYALREGVLLDALERTRSSSRQHLRDLRRRSVRLLAEIVPDELGHAQHATGLALQLFDATQVLHGLDDDQREILEAAGLLCNVGLFISHAGHHKHSYYVIRNSERLTGFTDHEVELIAQVARYHRKSAPKPSHPEFANLRPADQEVVRTLAAMLRVAVALDRTGSGVVRSVTCKRGSKSLTLLLHTEGADASAEVYTAEARKGLLEQVLGLPLKITVVNQAPQAKGA
ncbi:MAG: Ppx/GppA family phosphatase [Actinomycetota bacterium]|nr:Ppx/GppA family phosphatase [Actinomycetota bacterium]